jgi:hypothetical protein
MHHTFCLSEQPVIGGVECIRSYQQWALEEPNNSGRQMNRNMLILGMSANASDEERREAFRNGMHFFCPQPMETSLIATILNIKRKATDIQRATEMIGLLSRYAERKAEGKTAVNSDKHAPKNKKNKQKLGNRGAANEELPGDMQELLELVPDSSAESGKSALLVPWKIFSAASDEDLELDGFEE